MSHKNKSLWRRHMTFPPHLRYVHHRFWIHTQVDAFYPNYSGFSSPTFTIWVCVCVWGKKAETEEETSVSTSLRLPQVTAVCQGLCCLFQMAQQVAPRVLMIPALIDRSRGSHGLGACRLIAAAWPLGPLRPLKGSGVAQSWQPRQ